MVWGLGRGGEDEGVDFVCGWAMNPRSICGSNETKTYWDIGNLDSTCWVTDAAHFGENAKWGWVVLGDVGLN